MEGPVLPFPAMGWVSPPLEKAMPWEVLVPTSWVGAAACVPQEFASLLNAAPFGEESSALYKQPGVRITPAEARGEFRGHFGGSMWVHAFALPVLLPACLQSLLACSSKNTPGSRGILCSGGSALGSAPSSNLPPRLRPRVGFASAKPP